MNNKENYVNAVNELYRLGLIDEAILFNLLEMIKRFPEDELIDPNTLIVNGETGEIYSEQILRIANHVSGFTCDPKCRKWKLFFILFIDHNDYYSDALYFKKLQNVLNVSLNMGDDFSIRVAACSPEKYNMLNFSDECSKIELSSIYGIMDKEI